MISSPADYIFFTVDKEFEDKITGKSGLVLDLVPGGEPGSELWHVREYGNVVSVPKKLSAWLKTTMDVGVGDRIYFHFHTVCEENRYEIDGIRVYKVHYGEVYCAIRDEKVIMLNDYILCEPVMETEDEITTKSGLITKLQPEPKPLRAKVVHTPLNITNLLADLKAGDEIYYDTHSDIPIKIEGKMYYRMKLKDVLAKYEQ